MFPKLPCGGHRTVSEQQGTWWSVAGIPVIVRACLTTLPIGGQPCSLGSCSALGYLYYALLLSVSAAAQ